MFLLDDGGIVSSASDLSAAATCEYAVLRALDAKLGLTPALELGTDAMLERAARLGDRHEQRVLAGLLARFGPWDPVTGTGVAQIERPARQTDRALLEAKRAETLDVLRTGAGVVYQAGFFDGRFAGWADFLVREPSGRYAVCDTKLARHAQVTALLQLAAYADQLLAGDVPVASKVQLWLGDGTATSHRLDDLLPVYRVRRAGLEHILDSHRAAGTAVEWGDERYRACLRCELCVPELVSRRDVLLVAGLRTTQRARLRQGQISTIDELAAGEGAVDGIGAATLATLRAQARLQVAQHPPAATTDGDGGWPSPSDDHPVRFEIHTPEAIAALPPANDGDIFFDFEGDPLWTERPGHEEWGLEYLFGFVETPEMPGAEPTFRAFWAHDRAEEKQALLDFLGYLEQRRAEYPGMRVYHYAPYERAALLRLAGRHGVGEEVVDRLLREGVLVDLYATVRAALRTGQDSYSLKKLEPLYMPEPRSGDVTTADDSIVEYAEACAHRDAGDDAEWRRRLRQIEEYNHLDCLSTLRLRDWLLAQAATVGFAPGADGGPAPEPPAAGDGDGPDGVGPEDAALAELLQAFADSGTQVGETGTDGLGTSTDAGHVIGDGAATDSGMPTAVEVATDQGVGGPERDPHRQAVAMLAAALGYHRREGKPFWWGHFDRLAADPTEWADTRDTFVADEVTVESDWRTRPGKRTLGRRVRMVGRLEAGSSLDRGNERWLLYEPPLPACAKSSTTGRRGWTERATVLDVASSTDGRDVITISEGLRQADPPHDRLPMAIVPRLGPPTAGLTAKIRELTEAVARSLPTIPHQSALDLLRRLPPRLHSGELPAAAPHADGPIEAITAAVLGLDHSYLAVQGPPGTGKTYVGARVIAGLVRRGWRVGVVAQSHAVVENLLAEVVAAGVPPSAIGKKRGGSQGADHEAPWTWIADARFAAFYAANPDGVVVGGTAWDFTNPNRLPDAPLDLLVVDEAGQFSLANTVAVSTAARNLLLLGDPQQLPQVSQGRHPEPVDHSALGWLTDGHDTLPPELGYFLDRTWRMHPALCRAVSRLSYAERLTNMRHTAERSLDEVEPGVHTVLVTHEGNAVISVEEAREVVTQARAVLGRQWRDPAAGAARQLTENDVLVVAAYNAQVGAIRRALDSAGLAQVRVGTVDRFQGQQAPVVIVSMAASSPQDVPRGMEFLLNRNRVNVAVSRGQWCAVIIRSPALTEYLPSRPPQLAELGAFLGLGEEQSVAPAASPMGSR